MSNKQDTEKIAKYEALLKKVYVLLYEGEGYSHLEVDGVIADGIMEDIKKLKLDA